MTYGKSRRAVTDALDGDASVDAALRRAVFALATDHDEFAEQVTAQHDETMEAIAVHVAEQNVALGKLRGLLLSTAVTFIAALIAMITNLMVN